MIPFLAGILPMAFNLLTEPWLPLKRRSGVTEWVSPAHLTDRLNDDRFVAPDWGRADHDRLKRRPDLGKAR